MGTKTNMRKDPQMQAILAILQSRAHNVSLTLDQMEASEKTHEAELEAAAKQQMPTTSKNDPLAKGQVMLKRLKREERRKYEKERALRKNELTKLSESIRYAQ